MIILINAMKSRQHRCPEKCNAEMARMGVKLNNIDAMPSP
jgi:hypothetical protein